MKFAFLTMMVAGWLTCSSPATAETLEDVLTRMDQGAQGFKGMVAKPSNCPVDVVTSDAAAIRAAVGTNHISGHGSLTIQQTWVETDIFYFACNDFAFRMAVTFVDDNGHTLTSTTRVSEAARPHPCPSP